MINTRTPINPGPTYKEIELQTKVNHIANKFIENKKIFVNLRPIEAPNIKYSLS